MYEKKGATFFRLLIFVCLLPFIKIIVHMVLGNYQMITVAAFPIALIVVYFLNTTRNVFVINNKYLWFVSYIFTKAIIDVIIGDSTLVSSFSSSVRFGYLVLGSAFAVSFVISNKIAKKIFDISFAFFCITVLIGCSQAFSWLPLHNIFTNYGGNLMSATVLGNSRVNGGVGGTVIGYSCYIVLNAMVFVFGENYYSKKQKIAYLIGIISAAILNYSRAAFVGLLLFFVGYLVFYKMKTVNIGYKLLLVICVVCAVGWYCTTDNEMVRYIFVNDQFRQASDATRISSTIRGLRAMNTPKKFLFGVSTGQNTGFTTTGKLQTDGAFVAFIVDYGFCGIILYLLFFVSLFFNIIKFDYINNKKRIIATAVFTVLLLSGINSGLFENVNMLFFPFWVATMVAFCKGGCDDERRN